MKALNDLVQAMVTAGCDAGQIARAANVFTSRQLGSNAEGSGLNGAAVSLADERVRRKREADKKRQRNFRAQKKAKAVAAPASRMTVTPVMRDGHTCVSPATGVTSVTVIPIAERRRDAVQGNIEEFWPLQYDAQKSESATCHAKDRDCHAVTVTPLPPDSAYIIARAPALIPVGSSNEDPPIVSPLPSEGPQARKPSRSTGACLPDDWSPSEELFGYGAKQGLTREQTASIMEDMRLWARANRNRAIARKADWNATMMGAIRRDAAKFRARVAPASRGGFANMLAKDMGFLNGHQPEKTGSEQIVPRFSFDGCNRRGAGCGDDGDLSRNPAMLLVADSLRRM
jgi:hypothetical protein